MIRMGDKVGALLLIGAGICCFVLAGVVAWAIEALKVAANTGL